MHPDPIGSGPSTTTGALPRVVVVGGGFAGFHALRHLRRMLSRRAELILVAPTDYLLYSPLLPEFATGALNPRDIAVPYRQTLRGVRPVFGHATDIDLHARTVAVRSRDGRLREERWDRLVLAPGSVTRRFDIPGLEEHAHGLKTLEEALFLRNHVLTQLDAADSLPRTEAGLAERRERLTVVSVGAGYTGTERGIEIRLGVTVASATATSVTLTDGTTIPTRTLVWSAGVSPSPLVARLGRHTVKGRLVVDASLALPGVEHVWALGDAAAVPDLARADYGGADRPAPITPPTAQHAQRQGKAVARNVAASLGVGTAKAYRHPDLGLVADLGGPAGVARALRVQLRERPAKALARSYHLLALPSVAARVRVATDWTLGAALPVEVVRLADVRPEDALMGPAQGTDVYRPADGRPATSTVDR